MPRPPNDADHTRRPSLLTETVALLRDVEMTGTIFLIALTALVCCLAAGPSLEIIVPLGVLGLWHFVSALWRRCAKTRR